MTLIPTICSFMTPAMRSSNIRGKEWRIRASGGMRDGLEEHSVEAVLQFITITVVITEVFLA